MPTQPAPDSSLRGRDAAKYFPEWREDEKKVVVFRQSARGGPQQGFCDQSATWSHEAPEDVPAQLASTTLDIELWTEFLTTLKADEPRTNYLVCCGIPVAIFAVCLGAAAATETLWVLVLGLLVAAAVAGASVWLRVRAYERFRLAMVDKFRGPMSNRGVDVSLDWFTDEAHKIHKFFVLRPETAAATAV